MSAVDVVAVDQPEQAEDGPSTGLPRILPWAVLTLGLFLVLHTIGSLLNEVQVATNSTFGALGGVASGYSPGVVDRTQSLLATWADASSKNRLSHDLIAWTARSYTAMEYLFLIVYLLLLLGLWRRVRKHLPADADGKASGNLVRWMAYRKWAPMLAVGAAVADAAQNSIRFYLIEETVAGNPVPDAVVGVGWAFALIKVVLLGVTGVLLLVLLYDTGKLTMWLRQARRALWRLRVVVVAIAVYALLLLDDATGQVIDLTRRWDDNGTGLAAGLLVFLSSLLLGLSIWLYSRRVILAENEQSPAKVPWTLVLLGFAVVTAGLGVAFGWRNIFIFPIIAIVVVLLGLLVRKPLTGAPNRAAAADNAKQARHEDAGPQKEDDTTAVRRATRALAVAAPLTVAMLTATAFAPVMIVLPLSHQEKTTVFQLAVLFVAVAVLGAPIAAVGGCALLRAWDAKEKPRQLETRYLISAGALVVVLGVSITGAVLHWAVVTAILVISAFLAAVMLALGEAQRWSETHTAPGGLIVIGFTRLPVATLLIVSLVATSFTLDNGAAHNVHRQGTLPSGLSTADGRTGVSLSDAFNQWVDANCAGAGHTGAVPMYLVAAPGGGIRAAYWTASSLTDLFGADRSSTLSNCPGTAAADRIFAMGGASGGSLGVLSYEAGLTGQRADDWYQAQLGAPDFLTDPLSWMLTTDLARAFIGYGGEDRAQRLEANFSSNVTGLGQDFFTGSWGLGGRSPLMLLTGTQVESGCRLNISGLRLTDVDSRADGVGCASLGQGADQSNAARTTDLLDVVCDADGQNPRGISKATAALLSARFPYVSPSGQMYYCVDKPDEQQSSTAIVDGGYAENSGIGMLLSLWPRLDALITAHNEAGGNATIVPVFIEVANDYAQVASPTQRGRTVEGLVPPLTQSRPAELDGRAEEQTAAATFAGPVPGQGAACDLTATTGRFLVISPLTSPGLPAPLAWTLSQVAVDDLNAQRATAVTQPGPTAAHDWAAGHVTCAS